MTWLTVYSGHSVELVGSLGQVIVACAQHLRELAVDGKPLGDAGAGTHFGCASVALRRYLGIRFVFCWGQPKRRFKATGISVLPWHCVIRV